MDADCIFCKIIRGEIPSRKIYENEYAFAFLDIAPFEKGHTLVVPKVHAARLTDLPPDLLRPVMESVQHVACLLLTKLPCDGFNLLQNNGSCAMQTVHHVHFHIIPRWEGRGELNWIPGKYDSDEEMAALAVRLTSSPC